MSLLDDVNALPTAAEIADLASLADEMKAAALPSTRELALMAADMRPRIDTLVSDAALANAAAGLLGEVSRVLPPPVTSPRRPHLCRLRQTRGSRSWKMRWPTCTSGLRELRRPPPTH